MSNLEKIKKNEKKKLKKMEKNSDFLNLNLSNNPYKNRENPYLLDLYLREKTTKK